MDPIITLATVPAVVALVNLAKAFGVTGKWSALAAVVLGVGISLATTYADADVVRTVSDGLILGLGAAGLYDVSTGHRDTALGTGDIESASIVIQPE